MIRWAFRIWFLAVALYVVGLVAWLAVAAPRGGPAPVPPALPGAPAASWKQPTAPVAGMGGGAPTHPEVSR